jgi:uncharacterized membrane protein SirB2
MPEYPILKLMHVSFALASLMLFFWRGLYAVQGRYSPKVWIRVAIHSVDTLLLATGVAMAFALSLNPLTAPWLGAKLLGLVCYVAAGTKAIRGSTVRERSWFFAISLLVFGYIVAVALTKNPWVF